MIFDGVGGIARTIERNGYRFDIGGHRFFTRVPEVKALWEELLGDDMLTRRRRSRILFHGAYYDYPITAGSAFAGLGAAESARILASYLAAHLRPIRPERTLADWVTNRFGARLFETFFRTYTEKVWGMRCEEIGAQWAAQRISGLSLGAAVVDMLRRGTGGQRTLVTEFQYPRLGPGMLWERMRARIEAMGQRVLLRHRLVGIRHHEGRVTSVELEGPDGRRELEVSALISSIPLRDLAVALSPAPPTEVRAAAASLRYRGFLSVATVLDGADPFPDTWLYLHDRSVRAGRIQNFRAWSPELLPRAGSRLPRPGVLLLGRRSVLVAAPTRRWSSWRPQDLATLGFAHRARVLEGHVVRMAEAYPVYDDGFVERLAVVRDGAGAHRQPAGGRARNGMHRYNNMDHSMLTGLLAARNLMGERHDLWRVNADEHYVEPPALRGGAPR